VWGGIEWSVRRKPSVLGMISGAVASGVCYWACTSLKHRFNYDDSLDVFGVHGIGGLTGTLLCGMFANRLDRRNGRPARGSSSPWSGRPA
jgi:ammonium transporter, Amt family